MNTSLLLQRLNDTNNDATYPTTEWFDGNCSWADTVAWGCNGTVNGTNSTSSDVTSLVLMAVTSVVLAIIILATIVALEI
ncbi:5-hydroxytryptamine receptor-like [Choristoneura fumiferana]|uniref:5-hydroxytryptamine receptor-like n=1 Tax=Choristoneura fumiferana TaxID=7141 RepID=UPI003D15D464